MTASYLIGDIGPVFVADAATGTVTLVPGLPIIATSIPAQALSAGLVTDTDSFFTPAITVGAAALAPVLFADADVFYAASVTPGAITLAPAAFSDADTFFGPSIVAQQIPGQVLQLGLVAADDVIVAASVSSRNELQPALLVDSDDIAIVDAGWRLLGQLLVDVDLVRSPHVETLTYLLPNIFEDGDTIDTYPFYIHAVTGGIPVPPPSGVLTGSISYPRRMTGTLDRRPQLTGSITRSTRVLTGSLKR